MTDLRNYLYASDFRFLVLTGENQQAGKLLPVNSLRFSKIAGIESTMEYEEISEGGKNDGPHILNAPHKKHQPLVFERGVIPAISWFSLLKPGMRLGTWLQIIVLDGRGLPTTKQFGISDGIVTKWETSGLDAMGSSILVEKIEIVHDGITYL